MESEQHGSKFTENGAYCAHCPGHTQHYGSGSVTEASEGLCMLGAGWCTSSASVWSTEGEWLVLV